MNGKSNNRNGSGDSNIILSASDIGITRSNEIKKYATYLTPTSVGLSKSALALIYLLVRSLIQFAMKPNLLLVIILDFRIVDKGTPSSYSLLIRVKFIVKLILKITIPPINRPKSDA